MPPKDNETILVFCTVLRMRIIIIRVRSKVNTHVKNIYIWTDEETLKLVEIWGDDAIQAMLEGSRIHTVRETVE